MKKLTNDNDILDVDAIPNITPSEMKSYVGSLKDERPADSSSGVDIDVDRILGPKKGLSNSAPSSPTAWQKKLEHEDTYINNLK